MEHQYKIHGLSVLKTLITKATKQGKPKFICLPLDKAQEIMDIIQKKNIVQDDYSLKSNSLKAASVVLGIDPKELRERLVCPIPSKILAELAEAKTKIKMLEDVGDSLAKTTKFESLASRWNSVKSL